MLPGKTYSPEELLRILWHGKWLIAVPFVVVSMCTFVVVRSCRRRTAPNR